ncbi:4-hydroxyacetophenone monooxygenase [Fusarium oxysporum f. sp. albedinis]|nr:4-hydroxyacetophenone monooxygenase [Fusarium oxysporum f. sp. albedinis]KAK2474908.1 hypothetical protein H9L39_12501 [Fusarium oxysporum f. sp. albedinis]
MNLRYDRQVVVVTGAGSGLGKAYAKFFAARGASVVVNDLGTSLRGVGQGSKARGTLTLLACFAANLRKTQSAGAVVSEIVAEGGNAVADHHSVEDGAAIVQTAISSFGRIDILINNAGILRDVSFKNMADADWDSVQAVHMRGVYKTTQAAWIHFRKQKFGRVILTSSAAGLYGNFGQCNYAAAKSGMIGLGETLAKEGLKYNILTNIIAPVAASRMTATVMPPDLLQHLTPEWVVPLVAVLSHQSNTSENGSIFEVGTGHVSKIRWERSKGAILRCDETLTPGAVLGKWDEINDFTNPDYPTTTANLVELLKHAQNLPPNRQQDEVRFDGRVAVVTGGGAGLGRAYCIGLAKLGASIVVNDWKDPQSVVNEIKSLGGVAVPDNHSVEDGDAVIDTAIRAFGRIDILINNAGMLRDKAFQNMTDKMWDDVNNIHLRATYKCARAAYPYMVKQKYGRIVNTTSTSGTYGNYGQANYAAAKTAIVGFSRALAIEGRKNNIVVNCISPSAGTNLTKGVLPEEVVRSRKPEYVAAMVLLLSSEKVPSDASGTIFEAGCGWQAVTRYQRSDGYDFPVDSPLTPELLLEKWRDIVSFTPGKTSTPTNAADTRQRIMANIARLDKSSSGSQRWLKAIEKAKNAKTQPTEMSFVDKDIILYNLSIGASISQLPWVFEKHPDFEVIPSFGVIPGTTAARPFDLKDLVPNFSYKTLLHGEHCLEIHRFPIPTVGTFVSESKLIDILDKGKAAVAIIGTATCDKTTGEKIFYNELTLFLRGAGGFGGTSTRSDRNKGTAVHAIPEGEPDQVVEEKTSRDQAALYRLNGDRNPLHIDPIASAAGGFETPILHGLCSYGIATKHVVSTYGPIFSIKVRFAGTIEPGQSLKTKMWLQGKNVIFETEVKETGKVCLAGGVAVLRGLAKTHL